MAETEWKDIESKKGAVVQYSKWHVRAGAFVAVGMGTVYGTVFSHWVAAAVLILPCLVLAAYSCAKALPPAPNGE